MGKDDNSKLGRKKAQQMRAGQDAKDKRLRKFPQPRDIIGPNSVEESRDNTLCHQIQDEEDVTQTTDGVGFEGEDVEDGDPDDFYEAVYGQQLDDPDTKPEKEAT
ncbi:hypothetical protein DL546_005347 [Coniochaeta pulveracea]|uniref:Uncharacterized protein n=1 Tax=Coniochaeta pulveracea TaxID=177199 RepID=A0A420Y375_9PEZI|nr:hypothetical protein DL546_005347 [Coniochaeta pulveracea]